MVARSEQACGRSVVYDGSVQESRDNAPMRISFTHIPNLNVEKDRWQGGPGRRSRRQAGDLRATPRHHERVEFPMEKLMNAPSVCPCMFLLAEPTATSVCG